MDMTIVSYSPNHNAEVDQLFLDLQLHEHQFDPLKSTNPNNATQYKNELLESIKNQHGELLLAKVNNKVVGLVGWFLEEEFEFDEPYGYISDIVVSKEYRGQGIGNKLLQTALSHIKTTTKVKRIHIGVLLDNSETRNFYEKAGFKPYSMELAFGLQ